MIRIDLGGTASWIMVAVIGLAVLVLLSNPIGWVILSAGLALGGIYFAIDLWRKLG